MTTANQKLDWRAIGGVDLEALAQQPNASVLQRLLPNVTFGNLAAENLDGVDRNYVRLFRLSQIMLEYILNRQEELLQQLQDAQAELSQQTDKYNALVEQHSHRNKQYKRLKRSFAAIQQVQSSTSTTGASFGCRYCGKFFATNGFLFSHLERRHSEHGPFDPNDYQEPKMAPAAIVDRGQAYADISAHNNRSATDNEQRLEGELRNVRAEVDRLQEQLRMQASMQQQQRQPQGVTSAEQDAMIRSAIADTQRVWEAKLHEAQHQHKIEMDRISSKLETELGALRNQQAMSQSFTAAMERMATSTQQQQQQLQQQLQQQSAPSPQHAAQAAPAKTRVLQVSAQDRDSSDEEDDRAQANAARLAADQVDQVRQELQRDMATQRRLLEQQMEALNQRAEQAELAQKEAEVRLQMQLRRQGQERPHSAGMSGEELEVVRQLEASFKKRETLLKEELEAQLAAAQRVQARSQSKQAPYPSHPSQPSEARSNVLLVDPDESEEDTASLHGRRRPPRPPLPDVSVISASSSVRAKHDKRDKRDSRTRSADRQFNRDNGDNGDALSRHSRLSDSDGEHDPQPLAQSKRTRSWSRGRTKTRDTSSQNRVSTSLPRMPRSKSKSRFRLFGFLRKSKSSVDLPKTSLAEAKAHSTVYLKAYAGKRHRHMMELRQQVMDDVEVKAGVQGKQGLKESDRDFRIEALPMMSAEQEQQRDAILQDLDDFVQEHYRPLVIPTMSTRPSVLRLSPAKESPTLTRKEEDAVQPQQPRPMSQDSWGAGSNMSVERPMTAPQAIPSQTTLVEEGPQDYDDWDSEDVSALSSGLSHPSASMAALPSSAAGPAGGAQPTIAPQPSTAASAAHASRKPPVGGQSMLPSLTASDLLDHRASLKPSLLVDDFDLSEDVSSASELADEPLPSMQAASQPAQAASQPMQAASQPAVDTAVPSKNRASMTREEKGSSLDLNSFDDSW
eukprot:TRINITY_DN9782_c0_g1_i1.p1 TRINITY_DN9782_c0_g1~~TRINITY_DN9782_c0_g1_i1.p1  ORF type:complete len:960 (+),score=236.20 TRINITY_DN9782_c0_g1_i1:2-2881(+)